MNLSLSSFSNVTVLNKYCTLALALVMLAGCASLPPAQTNNLCELFSDKKRWYKDTKKANKRWGVSAGTVMAFMYQESRFDAKAKPPRGRFLWIFPGRRASSAYGYAQAQKGTWKWYKQSTGKKYADRNDFGDAADFIGWYNRQSQRKSNIASNDVYRLYLAYHEGHGGFNRGSYNNKPWLKKVAQSVAKRAASYDGQLAQCRKRLNKRGWFF